MKKWLWVGIPIAVIAFILGPKVWVSGPGMGEPTSFQLPFFILLGLFESVALGTGVAFAIFGHELIKKFGKENKIAAKCLYLAITWLLINWWTHDGLHKMNGMNLQGLLYIEYGFHVTLIIAGLVSAWAFSKLAQNYK